MINTVEIYFNDLTTEAQSKVCKAAGIATGADANWDIIPIALVDFEETDDSNISD